MNQERLVYLIDRYQSGQCTEEERKEFDLWYETLGQDEQKLHWAPSEEHRLRIWHHLMEKDAMASVKKRKHLSSRFNFKQFKPLWAAAVLLLIFGGLFYLYSLRNQAPVVDSQMRLALQDVNPGGDRATLTLSDGSQVDLSALEQGGHVQRGNLGITKVGAGVLTYEVGSDEEAPLEYHTITTPRGGQFKVVLPDSTVVWLNAASRLRYPTKFTDEQREVSLSGEAYFEVAKRAHEPFIVKTPGQDIQVLGTHFNVKAYAEEEETMTTLLEGKVKVIGYAETGEEQSHILQVGQASHWKNGQYSIETVDVERVTAWKNGKFVFSGENIKTIMNNVARWYDVEVEFQGDLSGANFEGSVSKYEDIVEVLRKLELTGTVHFKAATSHTGEQNERRIIVMP